MNAERIKLDDFLTVNKGRYKEVEQNTFEVDDYVYFFDSKEYLSYED